MRGPFENSIQITLLTACIVSVTASTGDASTVLPMRIETMADHAGQVIVGTVIVSRSYYIDNFRSIETEIMLDSVEYLKGKRAGSRDQFTLRLPGGIVGQRQMRLCCAPIFAVGEKWLLLLQPEYKTFPTVGLYQGAFRILSDAGGVERVYRATTEPVTGLDENGMVLIKGKISQNPHERFIASDRARVAEFPRVESVRGAISLPDFCATLEPILAKSHRHSLTQPAGRRIPTHYRAVPFRTTIALDQNHQSHSTSNRSEVIDQTKDSNESRKTILEKP